MNYAHMDTSKAERMLDEGKLHLRFMVQIYSLQINAGRFFLHEHPASA